MDVLKKNIIDLISSNVDILVTDIPNIKEQSGGNNTSIRVIYDKKVYRSQNFFYIIDYDNYDKYGTKTVPVLSSSIIGSKISIQGKEAVILGYNATDGIIEVDDMLLLGKLTSGHSVLSIGNVVSDTEDKITISSLYTYTQPLRANLEELYRRFEIGLFIYNDSNEDKVNYYMKKIMEKLKRNFILYDENGQRTNEMAYIVSPLVFDVEEQNVTSRVIYGSILIKTMKKGVI